MKSNRNSRLELSHFTRIGKQRYIGLFIIFAKKKHSFKGFPYGFNTLHCCCGATGVGGAIRQTKPTALCKRFDKIGGAFGLFANDSVASLIS